MNLNSILNNKKSSQPTGSAGGVFDQLRAAAAEARAAGDIATAEALEHHAVSLQQDLSVTNAFGAECTPDTQTKPIDVNRIKSLWSGIEPEAIHSTEHVCVFDCGNRGTVIVSSAGVLFTGALAMEPGAALLLALHAKENWNGRGTAIGSPEFLFNVAVADAMVGNTRSDSKVSPDKVQQAQATARGWKPVLDCLLEPSSSAARPHAVILHAAGPTAAPV